jgi:zinc transporter 1
VDTQWQRAEVLGALINGVFLLALCLSIFLEAIQRFFEPQDIGSPWLVFAVGSAGLASNILGLFLFHDHGHSHGGHSHDGKARDAEAGGVLPGMEGTVVDSGDIEDILPDAVVARLSRPIPSPSTSRKGGKPDKSRQRHFASPETNIYVHPAQNRQEVIAAAASDTSAAISSASDSDSDSPTARTPLLPPGDKGHRRAYSRSCHQNHNHSKPKAKSSSHSHGNLNMRGVFLHVLGDALGNVGVISVALALILLPASASWKRFLDPSISLVITVIIFSSALPLCKSASKILLQGVPKGISLDEVKEDIASILGVESVHELHIWQLSDVKMIASLHIQIAFDPECEGGGRYMQLASAVRTCLHAYGIHSSTIQPEYTKEEVAPVVGRSRRGSGGDPDEAACLLECGDGCVTGKCCAPGEEATSS